MATFSIYTASNSVVLHPSWDYKEDDSILKSNHNTLNQADVYYKFGSFQAWSIPCDFVQASDAALINEWWRTQTNLTYAHQTSSYTVQIVNTSTPVIKLKKPYKDQFSTTLMIREV